MKLTAANNSAQRRPPASKRKKLDLFPRLGAGRIARASQNVDGGADQPVRMPSVVRKRHDNALSRAVVPRIVKDGAAADVDRGIIHNPMKLVPYVLIAAVLEELFKRLIPEGFSKDGCDRFAGQSTREKIGSAVVLPCPENREVASQIEGIHVSPPRQRATAAQRIPIQQYLSQTRRGDRLKRLPDRSTACAFQRHRDLTLVMLEAEVDSLRIFSIHHHLLG